MIMENPVESKHPEKDETNEKPAAAPRLYEPKRAPTDPLEAVDNPGNGMASSSSGPDDASAAATPSVTPRNTDAAMKPKSTSYGQPKRVLSSGKFPEPGSMLGPFFCLGRLGKGTFCSIHKCLSIEGNGPKLVAAKVELKDFENSGVIEGESIMLQLLDESLPPKTVPKYMGLYKSDEAAAIVMELLPGEDMHYLRESGGRRVSVKDSVYLTADVMLPLLREMHKAGVVHRDVKPSNCVRIKGKEFAMVDFGLSKSILVKKESPHADTNHEWPYNPELCLRRERVTAEFRGTSMYASLRVHEGRDYSRRDDMWSLLYVFCDLISGGLPWMSYAATRDRDTCGKLKEQILKNPKEAAQLLMGEEYHVSKFKRDKAEKEGKETQTVAEPLALAKDAKKIQLLAQAFHHLASLRYWDEPDYDFIQHCLYGFLEDAVEGDVDDISWDTLDDSTPKKVPTPKWRQGVPTFEIENDVVDIDPQLWLDAETEKAKTPSLDPTSFYGRSIDFTRLPVEWQYRIARMEHTAKNGSNAESHVALRDFMEVALPLVYGTWDSSVYEQPLQIVNRDMYVRDVYNKLIKTCLAVARKFNNFQDRSYFYKGSADSPKRRKVTLTVDGELANKGNDMVALSRVLFALEAARQSESRKGPPPLV